MFPLILVLSERDFWPVSFVDTRGIRHSTTVHASSVLEAAAAGLKQIRETEMVEDDGVLELTVNLTTTTSHRVPLAIGEAKRVSRYLSGGTPFNQNHESEDNFRMARQATTIA